MTTGTTTLERLAGAAQWLAGVAAAALAVMLFTMGDGVNGYGDSGSARGDAETAASETAATLDSTESVAVGLAEMSDNDQLQRGETVYAVHCAICHGRSGLGDTAVALAGRMRVAYPDASDQIAVVADGRGTMPGFLDRLTADEIEAVVAFTRQRL